MNADHQLKNIARMVAFYFFKMKHRSPFYERRNGIPRQPCFVLSYH